MRLPMFLGRRELALVAPADRRRQREQPPGIEPFRKVVLRRVIFECLVGDRGDHLLHLHQVFGLADDGTRIGVFEEEFAEGELLVDIFVQLREQRFGILGDEPRPELAGLYLELVCDDCSRTGISGLSALMRRQRSMPASRFSLSGGSLRCNTNPTSEITPRMFFL